MFLNWLYGLIDKRVKAMSKEIDDLTASVSRLTQQNAVLQGKIDAEIANSNALKAALDAAIAGQLSPAELAALTTATTAVDGVADTLATGAQKLADSAAINSPSN